MFLYGSDDPLVLRQKQAFSWVQHVLATIRYTMDDRGSCLMNHNTIFQPRWLGLMQPASHCLLQNGIIITDA